MLFHLSISSISIICLRYEVPKLCSAYIKPYGKLSSDSLIQFLARRTKSRRAYFVTQLLASASASALALALNNLIDHSSYTHLATPLMFGTHIPWDKSFFIHAKIWTPVTLTLTSESAFRFQNLRLGFKIYS